MQSESGNRRAPRRWCAAAAIACAIVGCEQDPRGEADRAAPKANDTSTIAESNSDQSPIVSASPDDEQTLDAAQRLILQGRPADAAALIEPWLAAHPESGRGHFLLGLSHHEQRAYGRAAPLFDKAIALSPDDFAIHHFNGWCRYYLGDLAGARESFAAHLRHSPDEADSHFGLGLVHLELAQLDEAESEFRTAITLTMQLEANDPKQFEARRPDLAKHYLRLGDVHTARAQWPEARDALQESLRIDPKLALAWLRLSTVFQSLDDRERAQDAMERYQALTARNAPPSGVKP